VDGENNIWVTDQSVIKKFGPDGSSQGKFQFLDLNPKLFNQIKSAGSGASEVIYSTSLSPDALISFYPNGTLINTIYMQGDPDAATGAPSGFCFESDSGNIYVENSDSEGRVTERIQVYSPDGKYLDGFGGTGCGDYLCQTFNGLEFVPQK